MEYRFTKLAQYVRGWMGYFGISDYYRLISELDPQIFDLTQNILVWKRAASLSGIGFITVFGPFLWAP